MIEVLNPGLLSTVQDIGRLGYRSFGVPTSGCMDQLSSKIANWLVYNPLHYPVIESFSNRFEFRSLGRQSIGVCGSASKILINDKECSVLKSHNLVKNDFVKIENINKGNIFYLAFAGELLIEKVMESASTYIPAKFGGIAGRKLKKGDLLSVVGEKVKPVREIPRAFLRDYSNSVTIRVLRGSEIESFSEEVRQSFVSQAYKILPESNRIGYRLDGLPLISDNYNIPSNIVTKGIIQVTPAGQLIVLMADAQTTGGYPRLGKVIDVDIDYFSQLRPGAKVRFKWYDIERARELYQNQINRFRDFGIES